MFVLHVCELHYLNMFVCQHWACHCLQCMLTKPWPALWPWIMGWLVTFRSLWTVSWDSAKCWTWRWASTWVNRPMEFELCLHAQCGSGFNLFFLSGARSMWSWHQPAWGVPSAGSRAQEGLGQGTQGFPGAAVGAVPGWLCWLVGSWAALEAKLKQKDLILGWWGMDQCGFGCFIQCMFFSCNISLVLARVWFHVSTNLFCKIPMLANAQWLLELMDLKCLYFHSSCLYWLISVAINSMGLWNLMHAGRSCLRNPCFPWHCSVSVLCRMPYILFHPSCVLLGCFDSDPLCSIRVKFLGLFLR